MQRLKYINNEVKASQTLKFSKAISCSNVKAFNNINAGPSERYINAGPVKIGIYNRAFKAFKNAEIIKEISDANAKALTE